MLIRAEILKLFRRKTYLLMVVILAALVGMTAFFIVVFPRVAPGLAEGLEPLAKPEGYIVGAQQVIGQTWFPLILAVMMLGSEITSSFWATTLTREARRYRHLLARTFVLTGASWVAALAAIGGFAVVVAFGAVGEGSLSPSDWAQIVVGSLLVELTWVGLGLGLMGLLRSMGPAIGVALALSFGETILALWKPYATVSLTANSTAVMGSVDLGGFSALVPGADIPPGRAALVVGVWALIAFTMSWWALSRKDA